MTHPRTFQARCSRSGLWTQKPTFAWMFFGSNMHYVGFLGCSGVSQDITPWVGLSIIQGFTEVGH